MKKIMICIAIWMLTIFMAYNNDYTRRVPTNVTLMQKYQTVTGKYSRPTFIAVLKTEDGHLFDTTWSATDHYQFKDGDKLVMQLSPMNIKQNGWDNLIWFFGQVVMIALSATMFIYITVEIVMKRI